MGIGIPDLAPEKFLHPFGDQWQGDEFSAGRECEEHRPRSGGKDIPVAKRGKTRDQERHDNEAEQDCGSSEGDEEYLEIQEPLDSDGPGRDGRDDEDAERKSHGNDVCHPVERLQQDPEDAHDWPAPVVQHQGKAKKQAEEDGRRDNPVRKRQEGICRYELVDEVHGCYCGQLLGTEERGLHPGRKCQLEREIPDNTDYPEQKEEQDCLEGDCFCRVPFQAPDTDNKGERDGRQDRDLPDLDECLAQRSHDRDEIAKHQPGDDPDDETNQYPGGEVQVGQFHGAFFSEIKSRGLIAGQASGVSEYCLLPYLTVAG